MRWSASAGLSLEQIEGDYWGEAPARATRLVATVHDLRLRPVGVLGVEDLRVLVGQRVGLSVVVLAALARLETEPLAEGDFNPRDLLSAVLRVPGEYWRGHPEERGRVHAGVDAVDAGAVDEDLLGDIVGFRESGY